MSLIKRETTSNHLSSAVNIFKSIEQEVSRKRPGSGQPIQTKKSPLPSRKAVVSGNKRQFVQEPEHHQKQRQSSINSQKTSSKQQLPIIKSPSQQQKPPIQIDKKLIMMKQEQTITSARKNCTLTGEKSKRDNSSQNLSTADTNIKQFNWVDEQLSSQRDSSQNKKRLESKEKQKPFQQQQQQQQQQCKLQNNINNNNHHQARCCIDFTMTSGKNDLSAALASIKMEIKQIAEQAHQNGVILNMSGIDQLNNDIENVEK